MRAAELIFPNALTELQQMTVAVQNFARHDHRVTVRALAKDVENGLAASSQGRMRPPWPRNAEETQHGDPADG